MCSHDAPIPICNASSVDINPWPMYVCIYVCTNIRTCMWYAQAFSVDINPSPMYVCMFVYIYICIYIYIYEHICAKLPQ